MALITVSALANEAVAATQDDPEGSALTVNEILRLLDVTGTRNPHLENPLMGNFSRYISNTIIGQGDHGIRTLLPLAQRAAVRRNSALAPPMRIDANGTRPNRAVCSGHSHSQ